MGSASAATKPCVRTPVHCPVCGQLRLSAARWPVGPVCHPCYSHARRNAAPCDSCSQVRVLVGHPDAPSVSLLSPTLCGPCSGSARYSYACPRCGGSEEPYKNLLCVRCAVSDQLTTMFGPATPGTPVAALTHALRACRRPRSVMRWLTNPRGGARVLRSLLDEGIEVSHDSLDTFDEREVWSLRRMLVDLEVLPERHDPIARLDVVLEKVTATSAPSTRALVRAYASWWHLRRARRRYEQTGRFTYSQFRNVWVRLMAVTAFLVWLDENGAELDALEQATLDRWLDDVTSDQRSATGDFLRWAGRRRLAPRQLAVTYPEAREPTIVLTDDERWAELRRCLTDRTIPVDVATAGAMLLLYGLPLIRIAELTKSNLNSDPRTGSVDGFRQTAGGHLIEVPPRLGRMLAQLPADVASRGTPLIESRAGGPEWLFPGRGAGGHVTYTGLAERLRRHGISVRQSRNAALIGLAADLPAPVLHDLFGLSIAASVRWARRVGRDWTGYVGIVKKSQSQRGGPAVRSPFNASGGR